MASKWLLAAPVAGALGIAAGVGADKYLSAAGEAKQDLKPATTLPLTRVVLFNSGVGYFSRSGEVDGDARVDLTFPESDINDLLKSMVLDGGHGVLVGRHQPHHLSPTTNTKRLQHSTDATRHHPSKKLIAGSPSRG